MDSQAIEALLHRIVADLAAMQMGLPSIAIAERLRCTVDDVEAACKWGRKYQYVCQRGRVWFATAAAIRELNGGKNRPITKGLKDWLNEARTGMTKSGEQSAIKRASIPGSETNYCTDPEHVIDIMRSIARLGISKEELPFVRNCANCGALAIIRVGAYCVECRKAYDKNYNANRRVKKAQKDGKESNQ